MNIAIIPARGGSQRIPRKNLKNFAGKPIIAWPIETAIKSRLFDKVVVSTDDEEIAELAVRYGAEVPFIRPKELSDNYTGTQQVVKHAIHVMAKQECTIEYVCCIYATAAFLTSFYLKQGYEYLIQSDCPYAFSVAAFHCPIQRAMRLNSLGRIEAVWPQNMPKRSQDLEQTFHDAGQFYWGKKQSFLDDVEIYNSDSRPVVLPHDLAHDIDTNEDWIRAENSFKLRKLDTALK